MENQKMKMMAEAEASTRKIHCKIGDLTQEKLDLIKDAANI